MKINTINPLNSFSKLSALKQNNSLVNFGYSKPKSVRPGDLSAYDTFTKNNPSAQVPAFEAAKCKISYEVEDAIKEENYLDSKKMVELELKEKELQQKIDELMNILLEND